MSQLVTGQKIGALMTFRVRQAIQVSREFFPIATMRSTRGISDFVVKSDRINMALEIVLRTLPK